MFWLVLLLCIHSPKSPNINSAAANDLILQIANPSTASADNTSLAVDIDPVTGNHDVSIDNLNSKPANADFVTSFPVDALAVTVVTRNIDASVADADLGKNPANEDVESSVSIPPGFANGFPKTNSRSPLKGHSWADVSDSTDDDNPLTPRTSQVQDVFLHEVDSVLKATGLSSKQDDFQEVLSKSQKKRKNKVQKSYRTEPYLTRGRGILISQ